MWNLAWESGQLRKHWMLEKDWPTALRFVEDIPDDVDLRIIPLIGGRHNYLTYSTLYHLLPANVLRDHGLPLLKQGSWPETHLHARNVKKYSPPDFDDRLSAAFSRHIWPLLNVRGRLGDYAKDEPLRLLSHNLDFWLPYIDRVAQQRLDAFGRCEIESTKQRREMRAARKQLPDGVDVVRPLHGGDIWKGEDEAREAASEMIELADADGRLRGIIDAVRSNRVEDDFSERWSHVKEDFERKLYHKRLKTKVKFVELHDTVPVHGPESEVHENLLWEDFIAFVDAKEREVVILLRDGYTRVGDIAAALGYANHSPVSKKLRKIRQKEKRFFDC